MPKMGISRSPIEYLLSHSTEMFVEEPLCFRKIRVSKIFMPKRGISRSPMNICCLTVPKNFVEEPLCVSEKFGYQNFLCLRGEYHDLLSNICCLTVPENFVGEPFCAVFQKISRSEKFMDMMVGCDDFLSKIFCFTMPKNFVGEPFSTVVFNRGSPES